MNDAYRWGPCVEDDVTRFRLWAPDCTEIELEVSGGARAAMKAAANGWHDAVRAAPPGTRYRFRAGDTAVPDPASRAQAGDVHGESIVTDTGGYRWRNTAWRGRPWEEAVIYELHAGLMGGFAGVIAHLPSLAALGVTAVELMPVAEFPGARNWGYDGVLPFAPEESYGAPDALKHLVDEAHSLGLMVILDVVYNHFGPDGNFLPLYARRFFREDRHTPWGGAIDFREQPVRRFFIENALYWLNEFHFDGLRLDAVHAIRDTHFLHELAREIRGGAASERHVHLIIENEDNDATLLGGSFEAQWNDDFHHALHVLLTGETAGYYADYAQAPAQKLARALREGFIYQGERPPGGDRGHGKPSGHLPSTSFVAFLQNHDHIGNRAFGERLTALADPAALQAAVALLLLCPQIPLLFMGEEAGAREPFFYFCDHRDPELAKAVRDGRRAEFAKFPAFADEAKRAQIPDPNAAHTFERSRPQFDGPQAAHWRALYKTLLTLRRQHVVPGLNGAQAEHAEAVGEKAVLAAWRLGNGARLTLAMNLDDTSVSANLPAGTPIWGTTAAAGIAAQTTLCWVEAP